MVSHGQGGSRWSFTSYKICAGAVSTYVLFPVVAIFGMLISRFPMYHALTYMWLVGKKAIIDPMNGMCHLGGKVGHFCYAQFGGH